MKLTSRNDRYDTTFDSYYVHLYLHHSGRGWEKQPIELYAELVDPSHKDLKIAPKDSALVGFVFRESIAANPVVDDTVNCKIFTFGTAIIRTPYVFLHGRMKKKGANRRKAKVVWELGDNANYATE